MYEKTDLIVRALSLDITDKSILEVACGCAELSISAAPYAKIVHCIDIDMHRVPTTLPQNVCFYQMDACNMSYSNGLFDTVIIYNAFSHVHTQWDAIEKECMRVLKPSGCFYVISTWSMDIALMNEVFEGTIERYKDFCVVKIEKFQ